MTVHRAGRRQRGLFGLINMFSGGALLQITIFALGIMPYITASIILQLLTVVIPRLEALKKEGQGGTAKITQYTRYLTVALGDPPGRRPGRQRAKRYSVPELPVGGQIVPDNSIFPTAVMVITMTAGTALIMWLGELVTDRGIGNGMSILMFVSIAAGFPSALWGIKQQGKIMAAGWSSHGDRLWSGHGRPGGLRRAGAAPHPGAVRQADDRPSQLRRHVHLHPDEGEPGGCDSRDLRLVLYIPALIVQFSQSKAGWANWIRRTWSRATTRSTSPRTSC